ncbi:hypothetical protein QJS83_12635 [Bdellovibrio sp. 22V]|uniref:hypothetical protein n=1 Tax=Bdellovibrio TaxID=958 RepID=UPI002542E5C9|nr:hypothetical protein [Bdellovibrio sp. 22V]WII71309.1 hypothetical protein QJS83_12635 [Bdellovibrio sp. 22V]
MMKFILPLLSFFMGSAKNLFKEPGVALTQQLVLHLRALGLIVTSCVGALALFCVGLSLLISRIASQFDSTEDFYFSTSMWIYSGMTVLAAGVLIYSLRRQTWLKAMGFAEKPQTAQNKSGALESAVALLVMDFIEERQSRRKEQQDHQAS